MFRCTLCCVVFRCTLCCVALCFVVLCVVLCFVVLCVVLCFVVLCVVLCFVVLCVVLCLIRSLLNRRYTSEILELDSHTTCHLSILTKFGWCPFGFITFILSFFKNYNYYCKKRYARRQVCHLLNVMLDFSLFFASFLQNVLETRKNATCRTALTDPKEPSFGRDPAYIPHNCVGVTSAISVWSLVERQWPKIAVLSKGSLGLHSL